MELTMRARARAAIVLLCVGAGCAPIRYHGGRSLYPEDPAAAEVETEPVVNAAPPRAPVVWREIGRSVEGRPLRLATFGTGARRVLWVGGIHGNEIEGVVATEELPGAFADAGLEGLVTLTILEDLNPDGRANGSRGNARGVDLNRNYPATNYAPGGTRGGRALSEPEAKAFHDLILELKPHLVIVAHSWGAKSSGPPCFINFDGPARRLAARFGRLSGYAVVPSKSIAGTPGSLGSWVGIDMQVPTLTIEYQRGRDATLCWEQTREAILAVIRGVEDA